MLNVSHRTSYSVGEGESAVTHYVWTDVQLPATMEELGSFKADAKFDDGTMVKICVSYNKTTNERIYAEVPFVVAQFIEGYKLTINSAVRPKDGVALDDETINLYKAANPNEATVVELTFSIGTKKHQKALKEKILAWKAEQV